MDITVYLPDELGRWAKDNDLNLSRMLRDAVEVAREHRRQTESWRGETAIHELLVEGPNGIYTADTGKTTPAPQRRKGRALSMTLEWRRQA